MGLFSDILGFASDNAGPLLGIGGQLLASGAASSAAERAAQQQTQASQEAIQEQARQFDITQSNLAPFIDAATRGVVSQQAGIGLLGPEAQQLFFDEFASSPAQQFLRDRGEQATIRNFAATGGLGGGRVQEALQQQGIGLASQEINTLLNRQAAISGQGQTAATNLGSIGAGTSANIGNLLTNQGQAGAAGILGQNQAFQAGISGVASGLGSLF